MTGYKAGNNTFHIWKLAVLFIGLAAFGLLLADVAGSYRLEAVDTFVYRAVHALQCPFLTGFFIRSCCLSSAWR